MRLLLHPGQFINMSRSHVSRSPTITILDPDDTRRERADTLSLERHEDTAVDCEVFLTY